MIHLDKISSIAIILVHAAKHRLTVNYFSLYNLFDKGVRGNDVFDTLESASAAICSSSFAIYSSLMAKKETGVPGIGFFDVFKNTHPSEYQRIAGITLIQDLTKDMMIEITNIERRKVYEHADQYYSETDF